MGFAAYFPSTSLGRKDLKHPHTAVYGIRGVFSKFQLWWKGLEASTHCRVWDFAFLAKPVKRNSTLSPRLLVTSSPRIFASVSRQVFLEFQTH
jgi:hypothetical protein